MPVSDTHPEYDASIRKWEAVRDCVKGSNAIKDRGERYLPRPNPDDESAENMARYEGYKKRANFVNFTNSTREGLLGMVFREDVEVTLPPGLEYLEENFDGAGLTLDQFARSAISEEIQLGRYGLLAEYPEAPEGLTKAEEDAMNLRASVAAYKAEDVLNWRIEIVGAVKRLSMVVLRERVEDVKEDGFGVDVVDQYRVLRMDEGVYVQDIYDHKGDWVERKQPRKAGGVAWSEIPFILPGSENNDPTVDSAPLYDIAELNLSHYRNSADFEDSAYMVGKPTVTLGGLDQGWVDKVMKGGIRLGSHSPILLPINGNASLLQAAPNQMPERGMEMKEQQAIAIGARLISDQGGNETAEAARIRYAGQTSKLATIVGNVESAIVKCIQWCGEFMGVNTDSVEVEINRNFYDKSADPQMVMAQIALWDRGIVASNDVRGYLRDHNALDDDRDNDAIETESEDDAMGGDDAIT